MSAKRIAARYAKSLIKQSLESGVIDKVREDMNSLDSLFQNREFRLLLNSPIVDASKKKKVFDRIVEGQIESVTSSFADVLFRKKREGLLPLIVESYVEQYDELKERSRVHLVTAVEVDAAQKEAIKAQIKESKVTHPNVHLDSEVDPDIIGGFVLQVGDRQYDASVRGQLEKLRKKLTD